MLIHPVFGPQISNFEDDVQPGFGVVIPGCSFRRLRLEGFGSSLYELDEAATWETDSIVPFVYLHLHIRHIKFNSYHVCFIFWNLTFPCYVIVIMPWILRKSGRSNRCFGT